MIDCTEQDNSITFAVRVVPRASRNELSGEHNGALKVHVTAPPVEGAANKELIRLQARAFDVPPRSVEILSGQTAKLKLFRVRGVGRAQLESLSSGK